MIAKISRGSDTAGLLRYLLGPGRANEHTDPHLIASWDGGPAALEPDAVNGRPQVKDLAALLDQPLDALHRRPTSTVWHCSLRNAPGDRPLTDVEWAQAACHVLDRVGLAPAGDGGACRWIVARHGEDHVHLLVTLARQDGAPARTPNDYRRAGRACQELEQRFDLTRTLDRDSTAVQRPTRAETEKAGRDGRDESPRDILRREVRLASLVALEPGAFLEELQRSGVLVKARYSTQDSELLTGYAVAWPGDNAQGGGPVWFSGSTLAPDLSLPRLQQRWDGLEVEAAQLQPCPQRRTDWSPLIGALASVAATSGEAGDVARLVHTAASALSAVSRVVEGHRGGPSTRTSGRLLGDLDRPVASSGLARVGERQLLAAAHIILRTGSRAQPGGVEVLRLEQVLLNLLRAIAQRPATGRRTRQQGAAARALIDLEKSGREGDGRMPSTGQVKDMSRGWARALSGGPDLAHVQRSESRRSR